jgi:hypothetical protein
MLTLFHVTQDLLLSQMIKLLLAQLETSCITITPFATKPNPRCLTLANFYNPMINAGLHKHYGKGICIRYLFLADTDNAKETTSCKKTAK